MSAVCPPPLSAASPELAATATNHPPDVSLLPLQPKTPCTLPSSFINSIAEFKHLSNAVAAFQKQNECLRTQIDSIKASVLTLLPENSPVASASSPSPNPTPPVVSEEQILPNRKSKRIRRKSKCIAQKSNGIARKSPLERICESMSVRRVRKFLSAHLSDSPNLREEFSRALSLAPNPPKLVLDCLGKFFMLGNKSFSSDSPQFRNQEAKIMILECLLLMMGMDVIKDKDNGAVHIEKPLMKEAEALALGWYKRMLSEGGVANSIQMNARGLLVFVSCFGIPDSFTGQDILDLAIASNAMEIKEMLHNSPVLMDKFPGIVDGMIKIGMEIEAVDMVYAFGLEERFNPQSILTKYLEVFSKNPSPASQASIGANVSSNPIISLANSMRQQRAKHRQLTALRSVSECLQRNKIDPGSILPEWQISEKITTLEKEIKEIETEKKENERKVNESEMCQRSNKQGTKRSRCNSLDPLEHQKANGRQDHRVYNNPNTYSSPQLGAWPLGFGHAPLTNQYGIHNQAARLMDHGGQPYLWQGDPNWVTQPSVAGNFYQFQFADRPPYFYQPE